MSGLKDIYRSGTADAVTVASGRLEDLDALERAIVVHEVDTVFHLGAQTIVGAARRAPLLTFETNVRGTWNVLEACRRHGDLVQRVVVASSDKAYGTVAELPYTLIWLESPHRLLAGLADLESGLGDRQVAVLSASSASP